MVYTLEQEIPSYLCDRHDLLHPWAAVRLCQEVTEYHGNSLGGGFDNLVKQNRAWVIVRSYYEFHRRPASFEKVMLNTWPRGNDGLFAFRDYRMTTTAGEVLLTGTSYWTLIDYAQRRAVRLKDFIDIYTTHDELATSRQNLDRIKMPSFDEPDYTAVFKANNSMIDHTMHVNNSEYIKLLFDTLAERDFDTNTPFSLELNFQHETKPFDQLSVNLRTIDNTTFAQITNTQGIIVNAKIERL